MVKFLAGAIAVAALASGANAAITVYHDFASYDAAVGGVHDLFVNFETDSSGDPVIPSEDSNFDGNLDIEGSTFSTLVNYSSPSAPSSRLNIADIDQGIDNEVGPFPTWTLDLDFTYTADYRATAFTGVDMEPTTVVRLYRDGVLVDSTPVAGTGDTFQFFGFTSTNVFDQVQISGDFYAIDAHYSTLAGATPTIESTWGRVKSLYAMGQ